MNIEPGHIVVGMISLAVILTAARMLQQRRKRKKEEEANVIKARKAAQLARDLAHEEERGRARVAAMPSSTGARRADEYRRASLPKRTEGDQFFRERERRRQEDQMSVANPLHPASPLNPAYTPAPTPSRSSRNDDDCSSFSSRHSDSSSYGGGSCSSSSSSSSSSCSSSSSDSGSSGCD